MEGRFTLLLWYVLGVMVLEAFHAPLGLLHLATFFWSHSAHRLAFDSSVAYARKQAFASFTSVSYIVSDSTRAASHVHALLPLHLPARPESFAYFSSVHSFSRRMCSSSSAVNSSFTLNASRSSSGVLDLIMLAMVFVPTSRRSRISR